MKTSNKAQITAMFGRRRGDWLYWLKHKQKELTTNEKNDELPSKGVNKK